MNRNHIACVCFFLMALFGATIIIKTLGNFLYFAIGIFIIGILGMWEYLKIYFKRNKNKQIIEIEIAKGEKVIITHEGSAWAYRITVDECDDLQLGRIMRGDREKGKGDE